MGIYPPLAPASAHQFCICRWDYKVICTNTQHGCSIDGVLGDRPGGNYYVKCKVKYQVKDLVSYPY